MPKYRMDTFSHLFKALQAGCPPHAGLAIGFDRLIAVMLGCDTVRDVIAFPKNSNGEDPMVQSPGKIGQRQLLDYHLKVVSRERLEALSEKNDARYHFIKYRKLLEEHPENLADMVSGKREVLQPKDKSEPAVMAAVMVDDTSDLVKSNIVESDLISALKIDKFRSIADTHGAVGESILIGLGLEKATPEEVKRNATAWGLPVEQLEELVRLHQRAVVEKMESARLKSEGKASI